VPQISLRRPQIRSTKLSHYPKTATRGQDADQVHGTRTEESADETRTNRMIEYEHSLERRLSSTSRPTTRYATMSSVRPTYTWAFERRNTNTNIDLETQKADKTPGLQDKGARRREGGYPASTAAFDLRRQADVCFYAISRRVRARMLMRNSGRTRRRQRTTSLKVVLHCIWSLRFVVDAKLHIGYRTYTTLHVRNILDGT
jgi:hypothetical protein